MSEFGWMTCKDPAEMVQLLRDTSERKKRLALDAYLHHFPDQEECEYDDIHHYFDDRFSCECSYCALPERKRTRCDIHRELFPDPTDTAPCPGCEGNGKVVVRTEAPKNPSFDAWGNPIIPGYISHQCPRCNGTGKVSTLAILEGWRTPTVIGLAQRIDGIESESCEQCFGHGWYDWHPEDDPTNSRLEGGIETKCHTCNGKGHIEKQGECDFSTMPILADALEEAGCCDERILNHCRNGDNHLRGCWVIDLILQRK